MEAKIDRTHPLCWGYVNETLPVFRNNRVQLDKPNLAWLAPVQYSDRREQLSGYISAGNFARIKDSAGVVVTRMGNGRVIQMAENYNFRGFWLGTERLFLNAIFFGPQIRSGQVESRDPG
jgi:hypothetical protein